MNSPEAFLSKHAEAVLLPAPRRTEESFLDNFSEFTAASNGLAVDAPTELPLHFVNAAALQGVPVPDREEVVEGLIPRRAVTILGGDGGTGKSTLALQLAVSLQTGANWCGRIVHEEGHVIFLTAEDEIVEVHRRLSDILKAQSTDFCKLPGLHLLSLAGEDALLGELTNQKTIRATALFKRLDAAIAKIRPKMVILDTLSDLFGGDEINRVQARQFIGLLRGLAIRHDCTVLLLAHPSLEGMKSGTGTSGSTGWNNSARSRLYFSRIKGAQDKEDDPDARMLTCKKSNYGPTGQDIKMRWHRGIFIPQVGPSAASVLAIETKAERVFLDLLAAYEAEGRRVGATTGKGYAPKEFADDPRNEGITRKAFADAMSRLFVKRRIKVEEIGPPSRRVRKLVPV